MTARTTTGHTAADEALGAIVLAGGRASRMGGAAKPQLVVHGRTLLGAAVDAALDAGAKPVTVVGPMLDPALEVDWVREDPPFGGPAAGVVAALREWAASGIAPGWTLLVGADLPRVTDAVARLSADRGLLPADADGVCLGDAGSRPQWLIGMYRTRSLQDAASALADDGRDAAVRELMADLAITVVRAPDLTDDIDTWDDARRFGASEP
jgi:molybdopterin-guanine dinucleotide biosynthesis protein A